MRRGARLGRRRSGIVAGLALLAAAFPFVVNGPAQAATTGDIATVAGGGFGDGLPATEASVRSAAIVVDGQGVTYHADRDSHRVRTVGTDGILTTVVGSGVNGYSGDGGPAQSAAIGPPTGLALDAAGNLFVADADHNVIRKVTTSGTITTFAGTGEAGFSGDGGSALQATMRGPSALTFDAAGNLYVSDVLNRRVRRITPAGVISTYAGTGSLEYFHEGMDASSMGVGVVVALATDSTGNLFVADYDDSEVGRFFVRKITPDRKAYTVAGAQTGATWGDGGSAKSCVLERLASLAVNQAGELLLGTGSAVRRVNSEGIIDTVVGGPIEGFAGDGGPATAARVSGVLGLAISRTGDLFFSDGLNARIRKVAGGVITTLAGNGFASLSGDGGPATKAEISNPTSIQVNSAGAVYFVDSRNRRVRRIGTDGVISTVYVGPVTTIALDPADRLIVADVQTVSRVDGGGSVTLLAGGGTAAPDGVPATSAKIWPAGMAFSPAGDLLILEEITHRVLKVTGSTISVWAGSKNGYSGFSGDGGPVASALFKLPSGIAADRDGSLYIADRGNSRIRKVAPSGIVTTVAGNGVGAYSGDGGPALEAALDNIRSIALDGAGNLYVVNGYRVRKIMTSGRIVHVAGAGYTAFNGDSGRATEIGMDPAGLAVGRGSDLYVADYANLRVRKVVNVATPYSANLPSWDLTTPRDRSRLDGMVGQSTGFSIRASDVDGDPVVLAPSYFTTAGAPRGRPGFLACSTPSVAAGQARLDCTSTPQLNELVVMRVEMADSHGTYFGTREFLIGASPYKFVSLGDDFAAGEGAGDYFRDGRDPVQHRQTGLLVNGCDRSARSFSTGVNSPWTRRSVYAEASGDGDPGSDGKYGSELSVRSGGNARWDLKACTGASTGNILPTADGGTWQQGLAWFEDGTQLDDPTTDFETDLVTISAGFNDVGLRDLIWSCASSECDDSAFQYEFERSIEAIRPNLVQLYRAVQTQTYGARTIALGYPMLFPASDTEQACSKLQPWAPEEQVMVRSLIGKLNSVVAAAAAEAGVEFRPTAAAFSGHEVCGSAGEWIEGPPLSPSLTERGFFNYTPVSDKAFRPNLRGQQGYAKLVNAAIGS